MCSSDLIGSAHPCGMRWTWLRGNPNIAGMYRLNCRRIVALAVAYAVAFNLVLPLLSILAPAAQAGAIGLSEICASGHPGPQPATDDRHGPICSYGMACWAPDCGAAALPTSAGVAAFSFGSAPAGMFLHLVDGPLSPRHVGTRFARAPPLA